MKPKDRIYFFFGDRGVYRFFLWISLFITMGVEGLYAQQARKVQGRIWSKEVGMDRKQPLPYATVALLHRQDSSMVKGAVTDENGRFSLDYVSEKGKKYLVRTSFTGMKSLYFALKDTAQVQLGDILMQNDDIQIKEVLVTGLMKEMVQKGDTTEINADAFKTPEGAVLEDLVKRIPGLVYNKSDHSLVYNGKTINEIRINGEEFFSGNKEIALENLPVELVAKLKIYDKKSKKEEFTGMDDGQKNYVLDLKTRKEMNRTWLTNARVGMGNNRKKDLELQANFFKDNGESFSLMMRSTNRYQNSTYKDNIRNTVGLHVTQKFGKVLDLSGNINYGQTRNGNISSSYHEQYLTGGNQYGASASENSSHHKNLTASFFGDGSIDKQTRFSIMGNFGYSPNRGENSSLNASFDAAPGVDHATLFEHFDEIPYEAKLNRSENRTLRDGETKNYMWMVNVMRMLDKKGNTHFSINLQNNQSYSSNQDFSLSRTTYYRLKDSMGNDSVLLRNQYIDAPTRNQTWQMGFDFTRVIVKGLRFKIGYNLDIQKVRDERDTYELSSMMGEEAFGSLPARYQDGRVDSLSNRSHSRTLEHQFSVGMNYSDTTWHVNLSLAVFPQQRSIYRKMGKLEADTSMTLVNVQPMFWVGYSRKQMRLNLNYSARMRQPSLNELMPLVDNSNPLHIVRGNPNLKKMITHDVQLNYESSNKGFSANAGWSTDRNGFTQVTTYNKQTGGSETYPVNINGNWRLNVGADWWKRLNKSFSLRAEVYASRNNRVGMINESITTQPVKSTTRSSNLSLGTAFSYQPEWGGIDLTADWDYDYSDNSLSSLNNQLMRHLNVGLEAYVDFPFGLQLRTDAHYSYRNGSNVRKEDAHEVLWNASATYRFLKKKAAEFTVYWSDILADEKNFRRFTTANAFYENRSQQIKGYFIVSFKYNFRLVR